MGSGSGSRRSGGGVPCLDAMVSVSGSLLRGSSSSTLIGESFLVSSVCSGSTFRVGGVFGAAPDGEGSLMISIPLGRG